MIQTDLIQTGRTLYPTATYDACNVTAMASISSPDTPEELEGDVDTARAPVYLVVVDKSGSMSGEKTNL